MNWNYDFIIAELFVLSVVYIYYGVRPKLPLARLHFYLLLMVLETTVLISDALGAYALDHWANIYPASYGFNMIYFGCFFLRTFVFFLLSLQLLHLEYRKNKYIFGLLYVTIGILELINLSTPVTGWIFYLQDGIYHRGPLYPLTYGQFIVYFIIILSLVCRNWKLLNTRTRITVPTIWCILACGYVVRWFFSEFLIANLFYMVVIVVILFNYFDPESYLDPQSGLYNEHAFHEMMAERMQNTNFTILACIVRNREMVRRIYTTSACTAVTRQIGTYLQQITPGSCVFYLNGDYILLLENGADIEQIKQQINKRFLESWDGKTCQMYLEAGIVTLDHSLEIESSEDLLQNIHTALKQVGDVTKPAEMSLEKLKRQIQVRSALEEALKTDRVELYLQPIFTSGTKSLAGAEALARLQDDELGLIYPGEFIPYAEANGSIAELGMQIFHKVCAFISQNRDTLNLEWINVNLSPIQCMDRDLPEKLRAILEQYHVDASMIHLEVTEEVFVDSILLKDELERLRQIGFVIALDDFGSGYANLARMITYPLNVIKLDRSLIVSYFHQPNSVLRSITSTLNASGYKLVAEGVEEGYMIDELHQMGCQYIQGFYFSKPIPAEDFQKKYRTKA